MTIYQQQLSPVISHAVRGTSTTPPSSGSPFTATTAAETTGLCLSTLGNSKDVMTDEQIAMVMWRVNVQIIAVQFSSYKIATSFEERELWKSRIWESLWRLNQKAQKLNIQSLPADVPLSTAEWVVRNAEGASWLDVLTRELSYMFLNAKIQNVKILRTDE